MQSAGMQRVAPMRAAFVVNNRVCLRVNLKQKGRPTQEYIASPATSWAGPPMSNLADFGCNEQVYIDQGKYKDCVCPERCPWCGGQDYLIGHGSYLVNRIQSHP